MQEPGDLKDQSRPQMSRMFPIGIVVSQETMAPRRVQVRLPEIHTDIADEDLPYYRVLQPPSIGGHNGASGQYSTIAVGTQVQVTLYDEQGYHGIVQGCLPNTSNDIQGDNIHGWRDEKGNSVDTDADGNMTITSYAGATIILAGDTLTVDITNLTLKIGDMIITADSLMESINTYGMHANVWDINAVSPAIVDSVGGAAAPNVAAPTLTPPTLPATPDVANMTDI